MELLEVDLVSTVAIRVGDQRRQSMAPEHLGRRVGCANLNVVAGALDDSFQNDDDLEIRQRQLLGA